MPANEKKPEEIIGAALLGLGKTVFALMFGMVAVAYKAYVVGWYWDQFLLNPYVPKPSTYTLMAVCYLIVLLFAQRPSREDTAEEKALKHDNTWMFAFSLTVTSLYWLLGYVLVLIRANYGD